MELDDIADNRGRDVTRPIAEDDVSSVASVLRPGGAKLEKSKVKVVVDSSTVSVVTSADA